MPLSGEALNAQGNAITRGTKPPVEAKFVTVGTDGGGVKPENSSGSSRKIKKSGHGFSGGEVIVFTELGGKSSLGEVFAGLVIGVPYYVHKISTTEFSVAYTKAQAEAAEGESIEFSAELKESATIYKTITEHTGAKTARKETGFAAAANLTNEDATAREIEASSTVKVRWILYYSAETSGTFMGLEATTEKELATGDLFKITNQKIQQNAYLQ